MGRGPLFLIAAGRAAWREKRCAAVWSLKSLFTGHVAGSARRATSALSCPHRAVHRAGDESWRETADASSAHGITSTAYGTKGASGLDRMMQARDADTRQAVALDRTAASRETGSALPN